MSIYNLDVFCLLEASHTGFPISALIHACVVGSRVDVVTLRDQMVRVRDSLGDFLQRWQGIRQVRRKPGLFYVLLCSELMEKVTFSKSKINFISHCQWNISGCASCTRKLFCLVCRNSYVRKFFIRWYRFNL